MCDPRWVVWGLCESHTIGLGQGHVFGETTDRQEKGKNTCALHLCLEINALWYSLYTGPCLFASLPLRGSPSLGLLETPQVSTWSLLIHQQEHCWKGGRFNWWIYCRALESDKRPMGSRWGCCCDLLLVDHSSSGETRPGPRLPALRLVCAFSTPQWNKKGPSLPEPR